MTLTMERTRTGKAVQPVKLGVERLLEGQYKDLRGLRVGLVCNQASVDHGYAHVADLFYHHTEIDLKALFGPQHGIRGRLVQRKRHRLRRTLEGSAAAR